MHAFNVEDPFNPIPTGTIEIGGIVRRAAHPSKPELPLSGGPQMVEVSRDGKRVFFTNSLYGAWDDQFYPDGVGAWMAVLDVAKDGSLTLDEKFFPEGDVWRGRRTHQVRLQGGDASSDSYCFP
jgi:selenium-binding protein 1